LAIFHDETSSVTMLFGLRYLDYAI